VTNKFLPFVTNKSSADSIFKALILRSKGLSSRDMLIVYSAILVLGIDKIKVKVSKLPEELSSAKILDELVRSYPQFEIAESELNFWNYVLNFFGKENLKSSENYTDTEITIMFSSLAVHCPQKLKEINYPFYKDVLTDWSKSDFNIETDNLEQVNFSSDYVKVGFNSFTEFKAYLILKIVSDSSPLNILPVFLNSTSDDKYKTNYCFSPYEEEEWREDEDDIPF
jgi:hypothetical protein